MGDEQNADADNQPHEPSVSVSPLPAKQQTKMDEIVVGTRAVELESESRKIEELESEVLSPSPTLLFFYCPTPIPTPQPWL